MRGGTSPGPGLAANNTSHHSDQPPPPPATDTTTPVQLVTSLPALNLPASSSEKPSTSNSSSKLPRSPFRFSSRLGHTFSGHSSVQVPEQQQQKQEHDLNNHRRPSTSPNPDSAFRSTPLAIPHTKLLDQPIHLTNGQGERRPSRDKEKSGSPLLRTGFFSNYTHKASKASSRMQPTDPIRPLTNSGIDDRDKVKDEDTRSNEIDTDPHAMASQVSASQMPHGPAEVTNDTPVARKPVAAVAPSISSSNTNSSTNSKRNKPKPFSILHRSKSISRVNERDANNTLITGPNNISEAERVEAHLGMRTAPLRQEYDRSHREMLNSASRNRSADRQPASKSNGDNVREHGRSNTTLSSSAKSENGGFFGGLKNSASKSSGFGRGLFSKSNRSYSSTNKDAPIDDEHYTIKVINLPLIEQTRATRIAKRLEESRDKTEFWMPAFPWRAIDYLNYRGTETEGLYRVPGSGPQIKKWQRRFDQESDIDLFEQEDLYDINIIGSMLKAWLRELPDELLPKSIQERVARECPGQEDVPQLLVDELSNLKPYNYYLLFAITCHLSLLLAHSEKNKMDFRNLCICFQPCMKIDAQCFKYLVMDWSSCWRGCKTEDQWLEQEYAAFDQVPPISAERRSSLAAISHDEENRTASPDSGSVVARSVTPDQHKEMSHSASTMTVVSGISTDTEGTARDPVTTPKMSDAAQMHSLSPIQPLSPMQF